MTDLISLVCPSCGGKLEVSPNATSLKCQYCGSEHVVKHAAGGVMLEAFARCPRCGRNDRSEKVTAVIASQTQEFSGSEQKTEVFVNAQGQQQTTVRDVPFTRKQVSLLGQKLALPAEPEYPPLPSQPAMENIGAGMGALFILASVAGVLGAICWLGSTASLVLEAWRRGSIPQDDLMGILSSAAMGLGLLLLCAALIAAGVFMIIRSRRKGKEKLAAYQESVAAAEKERQTIRQAWERAVRNWNDLYYCARDDCVFIPGRTISAPLSQLKEYLYQE